MLQTYFTFQCTSWFYALYYGYARLVLLFGPLTNSYSNALPDIVALVR